MILKTLKAEALNLIHVHSTISGLRRACSRGEIQVKEATDALPKLYYVTVNGRETIHALTSDLTKFLIANHISGTGAEELYSLKGITANWVQTEEDYNKFVDADYRAQYDWAASEPSMPWLVINFEKPEVEAMESTENAEESEETEETEEAAEEKVAITLSMTPNVTFQGTSSNVGTVSEDKKSIEIEAGKYVMFEAKNDLGLTGAVDITVKAEAEDAIYTAKAEVE